MSLYPLDALRNASIDRDLEPLLQDVRESLAVFPFGEDAPGSVDEILEAFDMARPRLNILLSKLRGAQVRKGADISTGLGFLAVALKWCGFEVTATERTPAVSAFCSASGIEVRPYTIGADSLPLQPGSLDFVILAEVVEHLRSAPVPVLVELASALRPGGLLLITTPNVARLAHVEALARGENFLEPFPEDLPSSVDATQYIEHIREYSVREIVEAVEAARLQVEEVVMTGWGSEGYLPLPNPWVNEIAVVIASR